jgi:hypothetical protein
VAANTTLFAIAKLRRVDLELRIIADDGLELMAIFTEAGFDKDSFTMAESPGGSFGSHGLVEVCAGFAALGGAKSVLSALNHLVEFCIKNSKVLDLHVSGFGITITISWKGKSSK